MVLLLLACAPLPSVASDLFGFWAQMDGNEVAVLEFWEEREFAIYAYALDAGPFVLNTGDYAIQDERLVMVADNDEEFAYPILDWEPEQTLRLLVSGNPQTYFWEESLP